MRYMNLYLTFDKDATVLCAVADHICSSQLIGHIRDRSAKSSEIAPKKSMFFGPNFLEQDIDNRTTALQSTIFPASADVIW